MYHQLLARYLFTASKIGTSRFGSSKKNGHGIETMAKSVMNMAETCGRALKFLQLSEFRWWSKLLSSLILLLLGMVQNSSPQPRNMKALKSVHVINT